jgi:hypothetical protein
VPRRRPIDLRAVREARRRLRAIAKAHPELTGPSGRRNRAGWEAALKEIEMAPTKQYAFRLPDQLIARLDRHVERMRAALPGLEPSRTDALRTLLSRALDEVEQAAGTSRKKK